MIHAATTTGSAGAVGDGKEQAREQAGCDERDVPGPACVRERHRDGGKHARRDEELRSHP